MKFPKVTEVKRLSWHPGDRVLLRVSVVMCDEEAAALARRFREYARLPAGCPVIVIPDWLEVSVVAEGN